MGVCVFNRTFLLAHYNQHQVKGMENYIRTSISLLFTCRCRGRSGRALPALVPLPSSYGCVLELLHESSIDHVFHVLDGILQVGTNNRSREKSKTAKNGELRS